VTFYKFYL